MATYTKSFPITVPIVSLTAETPEAFEVQNVAGAFVYDASLGTYTDYTAEANSAAAGDVPLFPAVPAVLDAFIVGGASKFDFVTFKIGTAGTGTYGGNVKYWNGTAWATCFEFSQYIYETINYNTDMFKSTGLQRLTLRTTGMTDWTAMTIGGKYCYYFMFEYSTNIMTVVPIADQIWLGTWSVAWTQGWSDTETIDDTGAGALTWAQGHTKSFSDSLAIADSAPGALSWIQNFVRSFADQVTISDTPPSGGFSWSTDMERSFTDLMTITDSLKKDVSKTFSDLVTIVSALYLGNNMLIADMLGITDQLVFTVNRLFGDTVVIGDVLVRDVSKVFQDNMTLADAWDKTPARQWFDNIDIADTLVKALSIVEPPSDVVETLVNPSILTEPWMPYIAIGTSNITQDQVIGRITSLFEEVYRKRGSVKVIANTYFVRAEFGQDEPTADDLTIYEVGVFDSPTNGNMAARWVLNTGSSKDNIDIIVVECAFTILHGSMYMHYLDFTGEVGSAMIASILAAGGSSVAKAKDSQSISDTLTWKLN